MLLDWTLLAVVIVLVLGGLFSVLMIFSLSRAATGGDVDGGSRGSNASSI